MDYDLKNFSLSQIKPEHLPFAYGIMALGILAVVRNPAKILSVVGGYMAIQNIFEKGKAHLAEKL